MGGPDVRVHFIIFHDLGRNFGESTGSILLAGGMAGIFSWVFTYPQDVLKSRLQADGWGAAQQYRGTAHCLRASLAAEGAACLVRGIGSTVVRAFPMNAVTFGVYSYVMKRYGDTSAAAADTRDTWMADTREKISAYQRVSTLATDGPSIICVQEPAISPLSQAGYLHIPAKATSEVIHFHPLLVQARLYPEQMLWACPSPVGGAEVDKMETVNTLVSEESFSNYCNFNQFTQRSPLDDLYNSPSVLGAPGLGAQQECHGEVACPSLLCSVQERDRRRHQITTQDFLLPSNLLTNMKTKDRIYGFYYIVA